MNTWWERDDGDHSWEPRFSVLRESDGTDIPVVTVTCSRCGQNRGYGLDGCKAHIAKAVLES